MDYADIILNLHDKENDVWLDTAGQRIVILQGEWKIYFSEITDSFRFAQIVIYLSSQRRITGDILRAVVICANRNFAQTTGRSLPMIWREVLEKKDKAPQMTYHYIISNLEVEHSPVYLHYADKRIVVLNGFAVIGLDDITLPEKFSSIMMKLCAERCITNDIFRAIVNAAEQLSTYVTGKSLIDIWRDGVPKPTPRMRRIGTYFNPDKERQQILREAYEEYGIRVN